MILVWVCIVLEAQELSIRQIVVIFKLLQKKIFNYGQVYVVLSRVTRFEDLHILIQFLKNITRNTLALVEYNRYRDNEDTQQDSFTITALNEKSDNKHVIDLQFNILEFTNFRFRFDSSQVKQNLISGATDIKLRVFPRIAERLMICRN